MMQIAPPGRRCTVPPPRCREYSPRLPWMRTWTPARLTFVSCIRRAVSRTSAARISIVDAVASGSTPPAWATLTTRSRSRIVSEKTTGGTESRGLGEPLAVPGEPDARDGRQVRLQRGEEAVGELDPAR